MSSGILVGKVCIVTGATRGIGKGIALQLADKGATVYITGRTLDPPQKSKISGSLRDTADEIQARDRGTCIPVQCDHSKDSDVEHLFEKVKRENDGQLDILVNNAYSAVNAIFSMMGRSFWEQPITTWDDVNNVGLRNNYICSVYAAQMMVPRKRGLIVNISSSGGIRYTLNVAYGIGKEALDRMAADCGFELREANVAFVSLWPGPVGTEQVLSTLEESLSKLPMALDGNNAGGNKIKRFKQMFEDGETTEFAGQCIAAMATDTEIMKKSGKIVRTVELGREYGLEDKDGHVPVDITQVNFILQSAGYTRTAGLIPTFVRIPKWIMAMGGNKFY